MLLTLPEAVGPLFLSFIMDTGLFLSSSFYLLLILGMEGVGRARLRQDRVQMHLTSQGRFEDQPPPQLLGKGNYLPLMICIWLLMGHQDIPRKTQKCGGSRGCVVGPQRRIRGR